jgi:TolB-like protein/Tfp pilus assembly protein PilF
VIPNQKSDVEEGALRERIAVLPLSNFSPNPQDEYLADGMTEELITAISMVEGLRVIARTSAMRLKNTDKDVSEIGRTLRVGTILEGSLRKVGEKIRVTVQLIDAKTEEHIWAQNYDGDMSDIFKIQSDIAGKVAEVLRGKLLPVSIPTQKAVNLEAYELYLKGRFFWNRRNVDGIKEALKLFQAAVEKDPNFAKAYSGIADCYSIGRELYLFERSEALNKAGISVRKALELDDSLAEAHASFGLQVVNAFQLREAEEEFNKALSLNPSYASAHHWYAICLADLGRLDDALKEASIAAQTDPLSSPARNILGVMYLYSRDYDKAIGVFTEILKMDTHFSPALLYRAIAFSCKKMEEECMKDVMRSIELSKDEYVNHQMLSYFLAVFGHMDDAMKEFDQAEKLAPNEEGLLDLRTGFFGCAGNNDGFYKWIVPALESKIIRPSDIRYSPWLDKMREDPRYNQLVERFLS